tara:strand:- start:1084 stop:9237 length:8154 start_codon:yes stop_codon:yes gene_type:complete
MPNDVLDYARSKVPEFKDVSDDELTEYIWDSFPEMREDKEFDKSYREKFHPPTIEKEIEAGNIGKPVKFERRRGPFFDTSKDYTKQSAKLFKLYEDGDIGTRQRALNEVLSLYDVEGETPEQKAQRMLGMQNTFQREKEKALAEGESGWAWFVERLPFLGSIKNANELAMVYDAANRLEENSYDLIGTPPDSLGLSGGNPQFNRFAFEHQMDDAKLIGQYLAKLEQEESKGFLRKTADLATNIPKFGVEFMTASPLFFAGKKGTETAVKKITSKMVKKQIQNKLVNKVAKQGMRLTGFTGGSLTQAVGMPQMVGENFVEILASDKVLVGKDDRDGLTALISEEDPSFGRALYEAYAKTAVETFSERTGLVLGKVFNKATGTVANKLAPGLKAAIARRWMKLKPGSTTDDLLNEIKKRAGWSGVIGEVMEERVGEIGRAALTREQYPDRTAGEWLEQLSMEGLAFSVPGATGSVINKVGGYIDSREYDKVMQTLVEETGNIAALEGTMPPQEQWDRAPDFWKDDARAGMPEQRTSYSDPIVIELPKNFGPKAYSSTPDKGFGDLTNIAYLSGRATKGLAKRAAEWGDVGLMLTPSKREYVDKQADKYPYFAVDNGAFSKSGFKPKKFSSFLDKIASNEKVKDKVLFVVAPDKVGDAKQTLRQFEYWEPKIREKGLPVAFVAQDGLEKQQNLDAIPWSKIDVLFLGGTDSFKLGKFENEKDRSNWEQLFKIAQQQQIPVHVGRVNSNERLNFASLEAKASTVDGTMLVFDDAKQTREKDLFTWLQFLNQHELRKTSRTKHLNEQSFIELGRLPTDAELLDLTFDNEIEYEDELGAFEPAFNQINEIRESYKVKKIKKGSRPESVKPDVEEQTDDYQLTDEEKAAEEAEYGTVEDEVTEEVTEAPEEVSETPEKVINVPDLNDLEFEDYKSSSGKPLSVATVPGTFYRHSDPIKFGFKRIKKRNQPDKFRIVQSPHIKDAKWTASLTASGEHDSLEQAEAVLIDHLINFHWDTDYTNQKEYGKKQAYGTTRIVEVLKEYQESLYNPDIQSEEQVRKMKGIDVKNILREEGPHDTLSGNKEDLQDNYIAALNVGRKVKGLGMLPEFESEAVEAPEETEVEVEEAEVEEAEDLGQAHETNDYLAKENIIFNVSTIVSEITENEKHKNQQVSFTFLGPNRTWGIRRTKKRKGYTYRAVEISYEHKTVKGFSGVGSGEFGTLQEATDALADRLLDRYYEKDFTDTSDVTSGVPNLINWFFTTEQHNRLIDYQRNFYSKGYTSEEQINKISAKEIKGLLDNVFYRDSHQKDAKWIKKAFIKQQNIGRKALGEPLLAKTIKEANESGENDQADEPPLIGSEQDEQAREELINVDDLYYYVSKVPQYVDDLEALLNYDFEKADLKPLSKKNLKSIRDNLNSKKKFLKQREKFFGPEVDNTTGKKRENIIWDLKKDLADALRERAAIFAYYDYRKETEEDFDPVAHREAYNSPEVDDVFIYRARKQIQRLDPEFDYEAYVKEVFPSDKSVTHSINGMSIPIKPALQRAYEYFKDPDAGYERKDPGKDPRWELKEAPKKEVDDVDDQTKADWDLVSGVDASIERGTLPRSIEAPHYKTGKPVSFTEIRKFLSSSLNIPIRLGVGRAKAHGFFSIKPEVIRMKLIDNIPTIAHEVGHYLHYIIFPKTNFLGKEVDTMELGEATDFNKRFDKELLELGKATSRKSYEEDQVRREGVAEFVREYLTNRPEAIKRAPKFHKYFTEHLESEFPEINKILKQATDMIETLVNQSGYHSILAMMKIDGHQMPGEKGNTRKKLRNLYTRWVNELAPLDRTIKQLESYGLNVPNDQRADVLAINYMGGWLGKVEHTLRKRQIDYEGNDIGPSLEEVLSGVDNLTGFQVYLVALRAIEKTAQGKESGLTASHRGEDHKQIVKKYKQFIEENKDKYESHRKKLDTFLTNELRLLLDAGFISESEFARIKEKNEFYVPFHRVHDRIGSLGGGAGKGFLDLSKGGLKGFHGGGGQITPPLESVVKNLYVQRDLVERNRVGQAFINNINKTWGGGRVADQIVQRIQPTEVRTHEVALQLKKLGLIKIKVEPGYEDAAFEDKQYVYTNAETGEVMHPNHFAFTIWRGMKTENAAEGKFSVWFDGKRQYYQMDDADLYRAMMLQDSTASQITSQMPGFKLASLATRTLRAGATLTIDFIERNPFRDQLQAAVYSKHGFIPFFDGFRGMLSVLRKDKYYWEWLKSGGRYSDFVATDRQEDIIQRLGDIAPGNKLGKAKKWLNPITTLQAMSELMETATRVQEYKLARKAGKSHVEATNSSKDVTLNFSRFGWYGKAFNQLFAFYNANMQDWDKMRREHMGANKFRVMQKAFMYITVPSMLTWWLGKDDERIQNLPWWRKKGFWNINLGSIARMSGMDTDEDFVFSLPKPFLLAHLYGTSVESALDYAYDKDPNAINKWFIDLSLESPLPMAWSPETYFVNLGTYTPTIARPVIEAAANYNIHTGRPLESLAMEKLPPHLRTHTRTSELMKKLAETGAAVTDGSVDMSPIKLDNFVRAWLGGLGTGGVEFLDFWMIKFSLADVPPAPAMTVEEYPGIRAFTVSKYEASDEVRQFYEAARLVEQRIEGIRSKDFDMANDKYVKKEVPNAVPYFVPLNGQLDGDTKLTQIRQARTMLGLITKSIVNIQRDKKMTPEDKRDKLIELSKQRNEMAGQFLNYFEKQDLLKVK